MNSVSVGKSCDILNAIKALLMWGIVRDQIDRRYFNQRVGGRASVKTEGEWKRRRAPSGFFSSPPSVHRRGSPCTSAGSDESSSDRSKRIHHPEGDNALSDIYYIMLKGYKLRTNYEDHVLALLGIWILSRYGIKVFNNKQQGMYCSPLGKGHRI